MLPFLQPKKLASVIVSKRAANGSAQPEHEEGEHPPALMTAAEDMIKAVHAKDTKSVASAMKAAHEHLSPKEQEDASIEE